jgi:hypothetical protein
MEANGDAFHGRPPPVNAGQLLPLLPRRRPASPEPGRQRASPPRSTTSPTPSGWIATSSAPCSSSPGSARHGITR